MNPIVEKIRSRILKQQDELDQWLGTSQTMVSALEEELNFLTDLLRTVELEIVKP